jgi:cell division transport system ATP-binding protein
MLEAKGVGLKYPEGTQALQNIDLSMGAGELLYIIGPSGSGKTSLLKLLMGMERPTEGFLEVLGQNISKGGSGGIRKLRQQLGPVFQEFRLIRGRTALENVMTGMRFLEGLEGNLKEEAIGALKGVGLESKLYASVDNLSWGECQRVAIARAVVRKPRLIVADEPTGNLDKENALNILSLLNGFRSKETSVIITTHATHLIAGDSSVKLLRMEQGRMSWERGGQQ